MLSLSFALSLSLSLSLSLYLSLSLSLSLSENCLTTRCMTDLNVLVISTTSIEDDGCYAPRVPHNAANGLKRLGVIHSNYAFRVANCNQAQFLAGLPQKRYISAVECDFGVIYAVTKTFLRLIWLLIQVQAASLIIFNLLFY